MGLLYRNDLNDIVTVRELTVGHDWGKIILHGKAFKTTMILLHKEWATRL